MPGPKFRRREVEERRARVSQMYLQGMTMQAIASECGVSSVQIWKDIRRVRSDWRAQAQGAIEEKQARELSTLDQTEREAWQGWQRSVGKVRIQKQEVDSHGNKKLIITTRKQAGDPRFLSTIVDCVHQRARILGLIAPIEARITGRLSIDDLRAILEDGGEVTDGPEGPVVQ